jgi:hypothetical protein
MNDAKRRGDRRFFTGGARFISRRHLNRPTCSHISTDAAVKGLD